MGCRVTTASRKMMVRPARRMLRAISLGVFWRSAPSTRGDHAVEEGLAGVGGDADLDLVGEDAGATGDGGAVAAGLADDGGGLAGDGGLVDGGHAFDDLAVAGDHGAGDDDAEVAGTEVGAGAIFGSAVGTDADGDGIGLGAAEGVGLGLAAAFGHGLGEVGEEDGEPEPKGDLEIEAEGLFVGCEIADEINAGDDAANLDDEHDGILHHRARAELDEGVDEGAADDFGVPKTTFVGVCH